MYSLIVTVTVKILQIIGYKRPVQLKIRFAASFTPPSHQRVGLVHVEGEVSDVSETRRRCSGRHFEVLPAQLVIAECCVVEEDILALLVTDCLELLIDGLDGSPGLAMYGQHAAT